MVLYTETLSMPVAGYVREEMSRESFLKLNLCISNMEHQVQKKFWRGLTLNLPSPGWATI